MKCKTFPNIFSFFLKSKVGQSIILLLILIAIATPTAVAQTCNGIPDIECQALYALYYETGGSQWGNNTNWLSTGPVNDWSGIRVVDGHVIWILLNSNNLTGSIPPELGDLTKLEKLWICSNALTGSIPPELGYLKSVEELNLYWNSLTGSIPPELGNMANLKDLKLFGNNLTGLIPPELGNLTNLVRLQLDDNGLTGPIPPELGNLTNLKQLYLNDNNLTGSIPPELGEMSSIERLELHFNSLTGEIPPELGNLTFLSYLFLNDNNLTGLIPSELGRLPSELGRPTYLCWLDLYSNNLSGDIPAELGNLPNLNRLDLHDNSLTGEIPAELGNLTNLKSLFLYSNKLTGELPDFLAAPPYDLSIDLRWNCLYSSDPALLATMEDKHYHRFMSTQTLPPGNVTAETVESGSTQENRVLVSWDPISYDKDDGGYQLFYRRADPLGEDYPSPAETSSDYYYSGMTADKEASSLTVSNLEPGVDYTFQVNTVTWAHADNNNDLQSPDSETDSAVTGTYSRAFVPNWKQAPGYWTGVVASNFGDSGFNLDLTAYDSAGILESLAQNPNTTPLGAGLQESLLGSEFLGSAGHEDLSWIELGADGTNKMGSIFLFGVSDTQMMDGAESQSAYAKKLYFTRPLDEGFFDGWGPEFQMSTS